MPATKERPAWDKGPWYESDNPSRVVRGASWRVGVWVVVAVVFFSLLGAGLWAGGVFTSGVKGAGDVKKANNSSTNRIDSQAYFQQMSGDITGDTVKLRTQIQILAANPGDPFTVTNYQGLYDTCVQAVTDYNASSGKTLFSDWKAADLPQTYDPTTACPTAPTRDLVAPQPK